MEKENVITVQNEEKIRCNEITETKKIKKNQNEIKKLTDKELISLFQDGYNPAFDCLYKRHYYSVFNYLRNLSKQKETAEDLAQDIFTNLLICFQENKFMGTDFFGQYLKTLCYCRFLNHKRKGAAKEILSDSDCFFEYNNEDIENIEQKMIKEEIVNQLQCLVKTLPDYKQNIVFQHIYESKVFNSIAFELNTSPNTIISQYNNSIAALRLRAMNSNIRRAI